MSKLLSKEAEDRLLKAARDVTSLVDDEGYTPTSATVKVAEQYGLGPEMVKRVCEAYNAGRLTYQRETNHDILDKMASFAMASPEEALSRLYPNDPLAEKREKVSRVLSTVVDPCYLSAPVGPRPDDAAAHKVVMAQALPYAPVVEKQAAEETKQESFGELAHRYWVEKKARQKLEYRYLESKDAFQVSVQKIAGYFKRAAYDRLPYGAVAANVPHMFGDAGRSILGYLETRHSLNQIKEAGDRKNPKHYCVDKTAEPYRSFADAIKAAEDTHNLQRQCALLDATILKMAQALGEAPLPPADAHPSPRPTVLGGHKEANWTTAGATTLMNNLWQKTIPQSTPVDAMVKDYENDLTDPDHENKLRTIRAKAMLTDFMSNDDIISGYQPDEVLNAYNSISQLAPRTSTQPAVIRPLLQKWLAQGGKIEPFEAAETANIENTIAKNQGDLGGRDGNSR